MDRRESGVRSYWNRVVTGLAIVVVTALATATGVFWWPEREQEVQPATLPAAVVELPPRALPVANGPKPPKAVSEACDEEALRATGVTLATRKKMREIREGEKYRAAYATCLRANGYTG